MFGLFQKMHTSAGAIAARLAPRLTPRRFAQREDGTVTAFAVMMFVLMVGASGIAIDVMRFETQRTQLQYTLDRAVLAAASLTQPYDPEGVVRDYFSIAGIEGYRLEVRVDEGLNFRRVHAYAELEVRSMFMQLFGVRVLSTPAIGAAEERVRRIEVSMVLDISGSMGNNNRMANMRPAAREFVSEVLNANENVNNEQLVSVSIVPYNGMVNAGAIIGSAFAFDDLHNASNCARFLPQDYFTTAIDPAEPIRRIAHFDYNNRRTDRAFNAVNPMNPYCTTSQRGAILPWQLNETTLHNHINGLTTGGWTAIDVGMRWGVALLDPAAQPAVDTLIDANIVHADFADRPAPYVDNDPATQLDDETIKVVVLMTDGDNTNQYDLHDRYRDGYSPIFLNTTNNQYSVWWEDRGEFWIPTGSPRNAGGTWRSAPDGGWGRYGITAAEFAADGPNAFDPTQATTGEVLAWADLWADYTAEYIAEQWYEAPARGSGQWDDHTDLAFNSVLQYADQHGTPNAGDVNLRNICDAANAAGIVVFAIGFEAPQRGQDVMRHCASSDAHYYDVDGIEISQAFASIARTINQLRLIQ